MSTAGCNCSESAPADWDDYVLAHPDAHAFHSAAAVRIGAEAFGLRTHFVTLRGTDGRLCGALPLVEQTIIPWTRTLVSLPFCTYGGPLADDDSALTTLVDATEQVARERRARRIVLRHARPMPVIDHPESLEKVSMVLELPDDSAELGRRLGSKLRSQIKRAERVNPEVRLGHTELLDEFYPVFCNVMRDLGTPVYPRRFFEAVLQALGERAGVVVIRVAGEPVSGAITVQWRDMMEVPWAGTLHRMNPAAANMRLYWELLRLAVARGCRRFDFGRSSRDAGTYRFKAQWGAQPMQLHWHSWEPGGARQPVPATEVRSRLDAVVNLWSKLPLPVANRLGPRISHRLPW
jgi:FemAB-related protein (PEP-CTERM system-associated)